MRRIGTAAVAVVSLFLSVNLYAAVARQGATVGEIVTAKGDERIRFVGSQRDDALTVGQQLAPGDVVKTGPYGGVAILFRDDTQIRVHRNSVFEVSAVRGTGQVQVSRFKLLAGSAWSRAKSLFRSVSAEIAGKPTVLEMQTPTATIGIRGTDWHVAVKDSGETLVTVVTGQVNLANALGEVEVAGGEQGVAAPGQAPIKRVLIDIKDRPLMAIEFEPRWFEILTLSPGNTTADILGAAKLIEDKAPTARSRQDWLALARAQYDRGRLQIAQEALDGARRAGATGAEVDLVQGMLLGRRGDYAGARPLLESARASLTERDKVLAELGLVGVDFNAGEYAKAQKKLDALPPQHPNIVDAHLYQPALMFFSGDQDTALKLATDGERQFPNDARFPAIESAFHLIRGEDDLMKQKFEQALAIDPAQIIALNLKGNYYHNIRPNEEEAMGAYQSALKVAEVPELWNNYALLLDDLGHDRAAEDAYRKAEALDPNSPLVLTNRAMWLARVDRLGEAKALLQKAENNKPGYSTALLVSGFLTLIEGKPELAVQELQKAIVANPAEPQAYTALAFAQYGAEQFADADHSIELARKADPDDPLPLIVGAVMAQDQAEAGKAIRFSREGLEKIRTIGSLEVESIVNTRSGTSNVGSSYANLDLDDWGEYYAQQAFSPYDASSHIFLSQTYPSVRAQKAEAGQGLILDPLAFAASNRYYDFARMPRSYLTIGGGVGSEDNAHTDSEAGAFQGFARLPLPVAYSLTANRSNNDGFRTNSESLNETVIAGIGTTFNKHRDGLIGIFAAIHSKAGAAGNASDPDPDDENEVQSYIGSIGYQHRFDFGNRLMFRAAIGSNLQRTTNAQPFGPGQNQLLYSLIRQFGLSSTRNLVNSGLFDSSGFFGTPTAVTDSANTQAVCAVFPAVCAVPLSLPSHVDTNPIGVAEVEQHELDLQFRHLFNVAKHLDLTYGVEWTPQEQDLRATRAFSPVATDIATLIDNRVPPTQFINFLFLEPRAVSAKDAFPTTGAQAYAQASWRDRNVDPRWWAEGGAFVRYFDDDTRDQVSVDPRFGLGFSPMRNQWLRAGYLREMGIPTPLNGTLAPIAVAGLAASDKLLLLNKQVLDDAQARWDAEWLPGLYSVVGFEHQQIDADPTRGEFDQRADELSVGVNTWFLERFGAFARYRHTWSEITEDGDPNKGNDVALLADDEFDVGLSWIHPRQIRASIGGAYVGPRWGDSANTTKLDGYFTVGASINWQPLDRHLSLTLAAQNLFDASYDFQTNIPAPGTAIAISAEYRF